MRIRLLIRLAAHVASTILLWSVPAHADPISAAILGLISGAPWTIIPGATGVLASWLGTAIATALPTVLLNVAVAVGLAAISAALRPPAQSTNPGATIVNLRQTVQDRTRSYGLVRVGGPVAFWKAKNGKRFVAVLLMTGEANSFVSLFLDETEVTLDGTNRVTQGSFKSDGSSMVQMQTFLGAPGQGAPSLLADNFDEWTPDHTFAGLTGIVGVFQNPKPDDFGKVYPSGREPTMSAAIEAVKVFDPRDASQSLGDPTTWKYSTNAALVIADWLTSADGLGGSVDWDEVADEADASDVVVTDRDNNPLPKWQLCGTYSLNQPRENVRQALAIACDAFFYDRDDGAIGFHVGRWLEPQVTITDDAVLSIKITEGSDGTEQANAESVTYTEPAAGYRESQSAAWLLDDGQPYNEETTTADFAPNHNQAVRVGKRVLKAKRARYTVELTLKLYGLLLRDQRFFRLEISEIGLSGAFELASWTFASAMTIAVTAVSVEQADFDFDAATEEPPAPEILDLTVSSSIPDPTGVTLTSPAPGMIVVGFDTPPRISLIAVVQYREVDATDWNEIRVPSGQLYQQVPGLPVGSTYEAQVQFRTATAQTSDWVASSPASVEVAAVSTPPGPVTGASATGDTGMVTFNWTAPNSPNYVGANLYTNTSNTTTGATKAATEYGSPNAADSHVVSGLTAGTYYGWIAAINANGDEATKVATGSFTVS